MLHLIAFAVPQALVAIYAFRRGGWPEQVVAAAMVAALLLGWIVPFDALTAYRSVETMQLALDAGLAVTIYCVALFADRYWPLWLAALQLLSVTTHGLKAYNVDFLPLAYHHLIEWISYLMLVLLAVGVQRYDRRRRGSGGAEPA